MAPDSLILKIGIESFAARLRHDLAPRSCECLLALLPYSGKLIQARWSGDAMWAPLEPAFPAGVLLPPEHPVGRPVPGEVLLYAGPLSGPELLIPHGASRFACQAGPIEGNPVLSIEGRLERLAELGHEVLWKGAKELHIEVST